MRFSESIVEDAALAWLESLGYTVLHVTEIAARDTLLPRLISGELRISVAEKLVDGAI